MSVLSFGNIYSVPALKQNKGSPETPETADIRLKVGRVTLPRFLRFRLDDE